MQEDARARIYDEYDKKAGKGVYAECTDPDSDDFYLTPAEKRKAIDEKLAKESAATPHDRNIAATKRINAMPKPEPVQQYESEEEVLKNYIRARHPGLTDEDWKVINDDTWIKTTSDIADLQRRAIKTGAQGDYDRLVDRAAAELESEKVQASRRSVVEEMQRRHSEQKDGRFTK